MHGRSNSVNESHIRGTGQTTKSFETQPILRFLCCLLFKSETSTRSLVTGLAKRANAFRWLGTGLAGDIKRVEIDARVGGKFFFSDMRDGTEARHWGTYLELDRPRKIVFTWIVDESEEADPSKVTLTIEPDPDGCIATIVHEMERMARLHRAFRIEMVANARSNRERTRLNALNRPITCSKPPDDHNVRAVSPREV